MRIELIQITELLSDHHLFMSFPCTVPNYACTKVQVIIALKKSALEELFNY